MHFPHLRQTTHDPAMGFLFPSAPPSVSPIQKSTHILSSTTPIRLLFFFLLLNLSLVSSFSTYNPTSTSFYPHASSSFSPPIPYTDHCNSLIPQPTTTHYHNYTSPEFLQFRNGYYTGGDRILNPTTQNFPKYVSFYANYVQKTDTDGVLRVDGTLRYRIRRRYLGNVTYGVFAPHKLRNRRPRFRVREGLRFNLQGYWSELSGKLCMVGSGSGYSNQGNPIDLYVVFKLNFPQNSTIVTSLVSGSLESVNKSDSKSYFEPISVLGFAQKNYNYTLILNETKSGFSVGDDGEKGLNISSVHDQYSRPEICFALRQARFELEYGSGCNASKNCTPIAGENGFLPDSMSFSALQCSGDQRLRMLVGFYNSSFRVYDQPLVPERMLVGEGIWDEETNRLHVVVCRIMNVTGSLNNVSIGDCSIRLSLWFPAILSIRNRSSAVGKIWSNKSVGDSGYFDRIRFRSSTDRSWEVPGLKYQYTEIARVSGSCPEKKISGGKGKKYPGANSYNLKFDMEVGNGNRAWGSGIPLTMDDQFYEHSAQVMSFGFADIVNANQSSESESAVGVGANQSILLNVSYTLSFSVPLGSKLASQFASTDMPSSINSPRTRDIPVYIAAEGIYNTGTGSLCMIGCRYLGSAYRKSLKSNSMDCEILINAQFPELDAKSKSGVKGSIKSTRKRTDPLYFDHLNFVSVSLSAKAASESIWRMDLEITMVLIANTLICIFVASQLFYVKKHPDVLPSISLVMLVILTLGHMIPLILNFEALFLTNRNRQNVLVGSAGWLEVNEVIVRLITMIAFLLQFYLLQKTWSSRLGDDVPKSLWLAEKKALYVFLPFCVVFGFIAWLSHWLSDLYSTPDHNEFIVIDNYRGHSIWGDLRAYAGLLLDGFLLPQILLNVFCNSKDKALSPVFFFGTTVVRLLPHAYDLYRAHRFAPFIDSQQEIYANPGGDFFSTAWDLIIPCVGLLFAIIIYVQQRFGGSCIIPPRFRAAVEYEKVPVVSASGE